MEDDDPSEQLEYLLEKYGEFENKQKEIPFLFLLHLLQIKFIIILM